MYFAFTFSFSLLCGMELINHIRLVPNLRMRGVPFSYTYSSRGALNVCSKKFMSQMFRSWVPSFIIYPAVCLTTGPKPLPKRALHTVRSRASSFNFQYPVAYREGRVQPPPPEIPKVLQNRARLNPIVKNC